MSNTPSIEEDVKETTQREAGKADRRQRIVDAARALLEEDGNVNLSMREIAKRAKVSIATPYNLFGSKRAIVLAVLEDVREFHERFASAKDLQAIERVFEALALTLSYHVDQPEFYRTLWASLLDSSGCADLRAELITPQSGQFWSDLLDQAVKEGTLARDTDVHSVREVLGMVFTGAMLRWVLGGCDAQDLEPLICRGYGFVLQGFATKKGRMLIQKKLAAY